VSASLSSRVGTLAHGNEVMELLVADAQAD
jgi:hypothetical protein